MIYTPKKLLLFFFAKKYLLQFWKRFIFLSNWHADQPSTTNRCLKVFTLITPSGVFCNWIFSRVVIDMEITTVSFEQLDVYVNVIYFLWFSFHFQFVKKLSVRQMNILAVVYRRNYAHKSLNTNIKHMYTNCKIPWRKSNFPFLFVFSSSVNVNGSLFHFSLFRFCSFDCLFVSMCDVEQTEKVLLGSSRKFALKTIRLRGENQRAHRLCVWINAYIRLRYFHFLLLFRFCCWSSEYVIQMSFRNWTVVYVLV